MIARKTPPTKRPPLIPPTTRRCTLCRTEQPLTAFYKNHANKSGHMSRCIICVNTVARNHHLARIQKVENYLHHLMGIPLELSTIHNLEQRQKCRDVIRHAGAWMMRAMPAQEVA